MYLYYRECPLAFYVFTEDKSTFDRIANSTSSGSIVHNNTIAFAGCELYIVMYLTLGSKFYPNTELSLSHTHTHTLSHSLSYSVMTN